MPTLVRFGTISVRMYADDHPPPHVHIVGPTLQVLVRISDSKVLAGVARPAEMAEAMAWVRENRPTLVLKWAELNERD